MKAPKAIYTLLLFFLMLFSCKKHSESLSEYNYTKPEIVVLESDSNETLRDSVITFARQFLGTQYCYATSDPKKGFDCSGFVNYVFKHFDIELPRSSSGFQDLGTALSPDEFQKGDILVFYGYKDHNSIGHVGIVYEANGMQSTFIHASSGKEMAVTISELGSDAYTKRFFKCINPFKL